jgi:hypothetical protein
VIFGGESHKHGARNAGSERGVAGIDGVRAVVDAPRDLKEGAVVVIVVADIQTEHDATGLGEFAQHRRGVSHAPRHLTVAVDTGLRSEFVREDTEVVSRHGDGSATGWRRSVIGMTTRIAA